jgi:hypothetical protein
MFGGQGFRDFISESNAHIVDPNNNKAKIDDDFVTGTDTVNRTIEPRLINRLPAFGGRGPPDAGKPLKIKANFKFSYGSAIWAYDGNGNAGIADHFRMFQEDYWPTVESEG